jgi:Ni,Fe-hydrogenase III large subunit
MSGDVGAGVIIRNGDCLSLSLLQPVGWEDFAGVLLAEVKAGGRVAAYFAAPASGTALDLFAVIVQDQTGNLRLLRSEIDGILVSLTPQCPQLHLFEREIAEQFGVKVEGHPWFKPVRFHRAWRRDCDAWDRDPDAALIPGDMEFYRIEGDEVHEVAVGPVHAGIIEPGHFRFQCYGERVIHLEISLGYQHRGMEARLVGSAGRGAATRRRLETVAGDTTIGHATAYGLVCESLAGVTVPPRAAALRAVALELERLANHVGDIGGLATDVGFLPTASFCGRIRGDYLNLTAELCGNRFGRGLVCPGGVAMAVDAELVDRLGRKLAAVERDTRGAVDLFFGAPSVLARTEGVGVVSSGTARELGLVGVAARACGLPVDSRRHQRTGDGFCGPAETAMMEDGDVQARGRVRKREIEVSFAWVAQALGGLPDGPALRELPSAAPSSLAVALVEGWRGEIVHVAVTDVNGDFSRYKIVDPSFHNWSGLALALRGEQISDFPLINKSFNLSYCGFDL